MSKENPPCITLVIRGARLLDPVSPEAKPPARDIFISGTRIESVTPPAERPAPAGAEVIEAAGQLAIPGLVSAHYHSHDTLLKGSFAPMPLEAWFLHALPPNYPKRSKEELRARVLIGALECLKAGITTVQDMATVYPFDPADVDTILKAYDDIGIRCVFAMQVGDAPGSRGVPFWDEVIPAELRKSTTSSVRSGGKARELIDIVAGEISRNRGKHSRITWGIGPATPENCSEEFLQNVAELSERERLPVFSHVYESKATAVIARRAYGSDGGSLIRHLERMGLLGPRFTIAHGVWLTRDDIERDAAAGAHVALNPLCNLKAKSGVAPIRAYIEAGVKVGLGTDNSSCSDSQNLFQAMKMFVLLSAAGSPERDGPVSLDAFRAATLGSAQAIGLAGEVGSVAPGMKADITLINLRDPSFVPLNDAVRQLVCTEPGRSVRHVIVDGRVVIRDGRAMTLDEDALYEEIADLMPVLEKDLAVIRARNETLMPYVEEAHRRTLAVDVGLDRFVAGDPA